MKNKDSHATDGKPGGMSDGEQEPLVRDTAPAEITLAQKAELDRRLAAIDSGEDEGVSWEDLKTEIGRRWG